MNRFPNVFCIQNTAYGEAPDERLLVTFRYSSRHERQPAVCTSFGRSVESERRLFKTAPSDVYGTTRL